MTQIRATKVIFSPLCDYVVVYVLVLHRGPENSPFHLAEYTDINKALFPEIFCRWAFVLINPRCFVLPRLVSLFPPGLAECSAENSADTS